MRKLNHSYYFTQRCAGGVVAFTIAHLLNCGVGLSQQALTSATITMSTGTESLAPAVTMPINTEGLSATTISLVTPPSVPAPGFGAPQWLVDAARADKFVEIPGKPLRASPLAEAQRTQSPLMSAPHAFQPTGSFSGKVVFAMAGHGWTYNDDKQIYYTQRALGHGIVEDFGNLDQMHIFAHLLWNSGATVVPLRPVDHQPNERILDNTSAQVKFYGEWQESSSKVYFGGKRDRVPYAFATAQRSETAVARYRPWIPESGDYPVYVWARDGEDRVSAQLYRIAHAGAVTEIHVNHRRVGKGWVWLGSFWFEKGDTGYVDVSNVVDDPYEDDGKHVVVADAVRFGNGVGDVPRPAGRSGFIREDEADCYWIERSLGPTADRRIYSSNVSDGNATIASPPRTAAYMNRETEGSFTDRVLVSFHSNAFRGQSRGCVALFNESPEQRPDYQELLARMIGTQVNQELIEDPPFSYPKWAARDRVTYNGITFGELRKDYIQNEMCATIVEVAFHDNAEDAMFLLDPRARMDMARATLRGVLNWFAALRAKNSALGVLPTAPENPVARSLPDGRIQVSWQPGHAGRIEGDPATDYRIYRSATGYSFDGGQSTQGELAAVLDPVTSSSPTYVRVTGLNAGGESWPSQVVSVLPALAGDGATTVPMRRALLIAGITNLDATSDESQVIDNPFGNPADHGQITWRVRPRTHLNAPRMQAAAEALTSCAVSFDSCNSRSVGEGQIRLNDYPLVIWSVGRQNPRNGILTTPTQALIADYLRQGGKLVLNGAHLAAAMDGASPQSVPSNEDRLFLRQLLGLAYRGMNVQSRVVSPVPGGVLQNVPEFTLTGNEQGLGDPLPSDVVGALGGSGEVLRYKVAGASAAAVAGGSTNRRTGNWMFLAFPFENAGDEITRAELMRSVLEYLR
ncbi:MAG: hypothetical protein ACR2IE_10485 [Candidatus Sumerlaeaceae bacterium]